MHSDKLEKIFSELKINTKCKAKHHFKLYSFVWSPSVPADLAKLHKAFVRDFKENGQDCYSSEMLTLFQERDVINRFDKAKGWLLVWGKQINKTPTTVTLKQYMEENGYDLSMFNS